MEKYILNEENKKIFLQMQPDYVDEDKLKLFYKRLEYIVNKGEEHIETIKLNGFKNNYDDIDFQSWFSFISSMIVYIEKIKGFVNGEEKLEFLISLITVIIVNFIPVSKDIKLILINKIIDFVPTIVSGIISVSKNIHKFTFNLLKKLKNKFSCRCC